MREISDSFKEMKNKVGDRITPIYLYSIQYDAVASKWLRLCNHPTDITFDGITYSKYVIRHSGTTENLNGRIDKVNLSIGNVDRNLQYYLDTYDGLKGKKVEISLVWLEKIDVVDSVMTDEYYIEDSTSNRNAVSLTLASGMDETFIDITVAFYLRGRTAGTQGQKVYVTRPFSDARS